MPKRPDTLALLAPPVDALEAVEGGTGHASRGLALTRRQAAFAREYVASGGEGERSAVAAGYAPGAARSEAYRLLRLSHVREAIRGEQMRRLGGPLVSLALATLDGVMRDTGAPASARVRAAEVALDRAGIVAPAAPPSADDLRAKRPEEMTLSELDQVINEGRARIAAMRSAMPAAPVAQIEHTQAPVIIDVIPPS